MTTKLDNKQFSGLNRITKKWGSSVYYYKNTKWNGIKKIYLFNKIKNIFYSKTVYSEKRVEREIEKYHKQNDRYLEEGIKIWIK